MTVTGGPTGEGPPVGEAAAAEGPAAEAGSEDMRMEEAHESELGVPLGHNQLALVGYKIPSRSFFFLVRNTHTSALWYCGN